MTYQTISIMKHKLFKRLGILIVFLCALSMYAQEGIVNGTINSDIDGLPLPGVNILVKGTTRGVQTDFDGNYSIKCSVGETLVFAYVGSTTKEVLVTASMFGEKPNYKHLEQVSVKITQTDAYKNAIKNINKAEVSLPSLDKPTHKFNHRNSYQYSRIKQIEIDKDKVNFTYFKPDIYYELEFNSTTSVLFFNKRNLPKLQSTYAQGASLNGELSFLGPETGNPFSYGPQLTNLEFDGSNYIYDNNGQLVPNGSGNGTPSNTYNNAILQQTLKTKNSLGISVTTENTEFTLRYKNIVFKDVFNQERSTNDEIKFYYKDRSLNDKLQWNGFITYGKNRDNQANINGFLNTTLLNAAATPVSFSNAQGATLSNGTQRSFNDSFNNPNWLLDTNRNAENSRFFIINAEGSLRLSDDVKLFHSLNYSINKEEQNFGLPQSTIGFENGYLSQKTIDKHQFNSLFSFDSDFDFDRSSLTFTSLFDFTSETLGYQLNEASGFNPLSFSNPQNTSIRSIDSHRNTLHLTNKIKYDMYNPDLEIIFGNNSYISSLQNDKWWLPFLNAKWNLADSVFDSYTISDLTIVGSASQNVINPTLFYGNQSHNSLRLLPDESLSYTANHDLFLNNGIRLEEKRNYEIGLRSDFRLFSEYFNFQFFYHNSKTEGSVFPVFEDGSFMLKNTADIKNKGIEMELGSSFRIFRQCHYAPTLVFSSNRTKVSRLNDNAASIPIAGFASVSKQLIVNKPAGVIVGSAYARDNQNNIIIDNDGFPIVDTQPQIIGDPTPDFNLGISNTFSYKKFSLNFVFDFQKGGDVWDGTNNVLNYLGRSQQSAIDRNISGFIFQGVNQQGQQNAIPVDFYNPQNDISQNRYVRYGFSGVAEDAIKDGSYINLKSINFNYSIDLDKHEKTFIRDISIGLYAYNLVTWTKFDGASPYRNLYDNASGQGLNFFNLPITSEVGFTLNIKI